LPTRYGVEPLFRFRRNMVRGGSSNNEGIINNLVPFLPMKYGSNPLTTAFLPYLCGRQRLKWR
jgi:hypothetical protein